jgi:hypothetical protein
MRYSMSKLKLTANLIEAHLPFTMSRLESILKELQHGFEFLKRDGLFVKATPVSEDEVMLETTTYVTDTDDDKDVDCLCIGEDDLGLGGSCVCDSITTGYWLEEGTEPPRGCVTCPACQRLALPWKLQKRCYNLTVRIAENRLTTLTVQPNANLKPMPAAMSEKIINICNAIFPEWSSGH